MKLFFRKYGEGPPLILLHGLYGSSDNWVTIARKISDRYTVYLPDQRNHGLSPHSPVHDYGAMSDDVFDLVTDLGYRKIFLAGHSMGGKTAMTFAAAHPEMLSGMLIADISPFTNNTGRRSEYDKHYGILKTILETDVSGASTRNEIDLKLSAGIDSPKVRELIMKNLQRTETNKFRWKLNAAALMNNLSGIVDDLPFYDDGYHTITGFPVIFLKGENSGYFDRNDFKRIARIFPAAELVIIPGAGHWLNTDNPDAVSGALSGLLSS